MPLITLSIEAGRTREQKCLLADAIYEALRAAVQIPENDRFVAIREHAAGDLIADPGYLQRGGAIRRGVPAAGSIPEAGQPVSGAESKAMRKPMRKPGEADVC